MIQYLTEGVKMPKLEKQKLNKWIKNIADVYNRKTGEIAFVFCSDEKILNINKLYLKHDYYTDIITFDYSTKDIISGDIFISTDTVESNSEEFKTKYVDELHRIMIHGILHLCGFDDKTPEMRKNMTIEENFALEKLNSFE